jgi:HEPN domain-containing protein
LTASVFTDVPDDAQPSAQEARKWLSKAGDDFAVASMISSNPSTVNWAACYHAQQAAEKALKAILVLLGIDFPRTHSLERILDLIPEAHREAFDRGCLGALSVWAVAGRYPEDIEDPTDAEVADHLRCAATTIRVAALIITTVA